MVAFIVALMVVAFILGIAVFSFPCHVSAFALVVALAFIVVPLLVKKSSKTPPK